ncbi:hypothetical protein JCM9957A_20170 [Kineosporia succinea]|uniref:DNA-binding NarL/FixJ family response regulator n=1 Tax=Kineosporia succinea TaxID=84632 RepID=A0ABT9PEW3_9ACTN|nr:DNA-binding NarL/FixJ family response regulator [Kineosporia succinea]
MDIRGPVMNGVEATRILCARPNDPKVLVLKTFDTDNDAFDVLRAGAGGFLLRTVPREEPRPGWPAHLTDVPVSVLGRRVPI